MVDELLYAHKKLEIIEFILQPLPCLVFIAAAGLRLMKIYHVAISKPVSFTTSGLFKVVCSYAMGFLYLSYIMLTLLSPDGFGYWITETKWITLIYLMNAATWAASAWLMQYERSKSLRETFYVHHFFWYFSFTCIVLGTFYVVFVSDAELGALVCLKLLQLLICGSILVILHNSKRQNSQMMPFLHPALDNSYVSTEYNDSLSQKLITVPDIGENERLYTIPSANGDGERSLSIDINMRRKIKHIKGHIKSDSLNPPEKEFLFVFEVTINKGKTKKVKKSLYEFMKLESILLSEYNSKRYPGVKFDVPKIDKNLISPKVNARASNAILEYRIQNLERFLKALAQKQELWCLPVVNFLEIDQGDQGRFLKAHEIALMKYRDKSPSLSMLRESTETVRQSASFSEETTKPASNGVNIKNIISDIIGSNGTQINSFSYRGGLMSKRTTNGSNTDRAPTHTRTRSSNEFCKYYSVRVERWEASVDGTYIEYVIRITDKQLLDRPWTVIKKYSEFSRLHEELLKIFPKKELPPPPSKGVFLISKDVETQTERRFQIENYLRHLLNKKEFHKKALIDFIDQPSMRGKTVNMRNSVMEDLYQLAPDDEFEVSIDSYRIALIKNKPKTLFKVSLTLRKKAARFGGEEKKTFEVEKAYKDFVRLYEMLVNMAKDPISDLQDIPKLPSKSSKFAKKKPAAELQSDLEEYLKELTSCPHIAESSPVRLFFGTNEVFRSPNTSSMNPFGRRQESSNNNMVRRDINIDIDDEDESQLMSPRPYTFTRNNR